jgi:serine phosphatase RsbU (regulator of sigma subunit)
MLGKWALAKNFTSVVVLVALLLLGNLWLFVWQHVDYEKNRVVQEASREAMNLANAFEAQVRNLIARADDDMQLLKLAYEAEGPSSKIVRQLLTQTVKDPTRFQLGVINEQGVFVVSADTRTRNMNYADRQYFSSQRAATQDQLFIGKTIVSRASGKPVIPLSRRITKPDGSFGGVVHTSLDTDYFAGIFTKLEMPAGGLISLNGTDGFIRFRQFQQHSNFGQNIRGGDIWQQTQSAASGTSITHGVSDGVHRLFAYRVMPDYPLFIVVASPTDTVMQPLEEIKNDYVLGATGLSLVLVAFALLLIDQSRKQKAELLRLRRAAEVQTVLREITEASLTAASQNDLYVAVYGLLSKIFPDFNMNIALLDEVNAQVILPYCQTEVDFLPQRRPIQKGLTEYTIRQNKTVWLTAADIERLHATGEMDLKLVDLHQWLGAPLRDSHGKPFGVLTAFLLNAKTVFPEDVVEIATIIATQLSISVERRKAEEALVNSESRLKRAQAIAHVGNWEIELATGLMHASAESFRIYGIHPIAPSLPIALAKSLVFPEDRSLMDQALAALLEKRAKYDVEFRIQRLGDGQERTIHSIAELEEDDAGTPVKVIGVIQDITERKQLEEAYIASKLKRANEIQQDALVAARVQQALLPSPEASEYLEFAEIYKPRGYIGGDLYFFGWRYQGNLLRGFLIDAMGHGMATALHTASLHALLRELNEKDLPLSSAMHWLNKKAADYFDEATFAGALGFEFDLQTRTLRWSCAGIAAFLVATKSTLGKLECPGMCLGIDAEEAFEVHAMPIDVGDSFYFMTDGMLRLLQQKAKLPLERFSDTVAVLKGLTEKETLTDDATVLCIRVSALPKSPVREDGWPKLIRFQDYGDYQRFKGEVGRILAEVTGKAHSLQEVAVHEALANAMECRDGVPRQHRARIRFNKIGNRLIVRVKTSRIGFAGNAVLRRLRSHPEDMFSFGEDAGMGRGIPIMLSTSHKMTYNGEGTELLLMWNL